MEALTFGKKLKHVFKSNGAVATEIAARHEVDRAVFSHLFADRRKYTQRDIDIIVSEFNDVDLNWLLREEPNKAANTDKVNEPESNYSRNLKNEMIKDEIRDLLDQLD
jgi:hypothetical protein